jgi:hypothetical protein
MLKTDVIMNRDHPIVEYPVLVFLFLDSENEKHKNSSSPSKFSL